MGVMSAFRPARLPMLAGGLLIVGGVLLMLFDWPQGSGIRYDKVAETKAGDAGFSDPYPTAPFRAERLSSYRIGHGDDAGVELRVVGYRDEQGKDARAIVWPADADPAMPKGDAALRQELWTAGMEAILKHSAADALFVGWWDNAQRIHYFTGRQTWTRLPVATAFPDGRQQDFWKEVAGGFDADERRLVQLAGWLAMDADTALKDMAVSFKSGQPVYWLVTLDDLARLGEIESLSGVKFPFEYRTFPEAGDMHAQIADVRRWANEKGVGSYAVQRLPTGGVRAWRITTEDGVKTLLARLLPFTTSLAKPLDSMSLVYQSTWGSYLSVYQWRP